MKEWNGTFEQTECYQLEHWEKPEDVLLFDIETTGFSPKNTALYMIGYSYYRSGHWQYRILLNEDGRSEYTLLQCFTEVLASYPTWIHFNGDGFDIPYLLEKCRQYETLGLRLPHDHLRNHVQSIDLYKVIKAYKHGLQLPNLKLKTIEEALQITRTDPYTGGDLIPLYRAYLKHPDPETEQILYRHNFEDLEGLIPLLSLLHFQSLAAGEFTLLEVSRQAAQIRLLLHLPYPLPLRFLICMSEYTWNGYGDQATITIPLTEEEMKYFLPDWKDYYYLPAEDTVIHKSVAAFVDAPYKEKVKKETCFLKKEGPFLPYPQSFSAPGIPLFRRNYRDRQTFVCVDDIDFQTSDFWVEYARNLCRSM